MALSRLIQNGGNGAGSRSVTGLASQALKGFTFITNDSNNRPIQGTIIRRWATNITVDGATVTVPEGYYGSTYTKRVQSGSASIEGTAAPNAITMAFNPSTRVVTANQAARNIPLTPTVSPGYITQGSPGNIQLSAASKSYTIPAGSASIGGTITPSRPTITLSQDSATYGLVTASVPEKTQSFTPTVEEGYVAIGTAGNIKVAAHSNTFQIPVYDGSVS